VRFGLILAMSEARKTIPKSIRFEVFKRDSFKCQYCGASAPDVLLQVDHIKAVSKGGTNDIINLITACSACNAGKSDTPLDQNLAVSKARNQLEQLQERREQLEMMMAWMEGLRDLKDEALEKICKYWHDLAPGWSVNDNGRKSLQKWIRKFPIDEICRAMNIAAEQYLEFQEDGNVTSESWEHAFAKIPGICRVEGASKENPDIRELYYIRGIVRKRLAGGYYRDDQALQFLQAGRSCGIPLEHLRAIALGVKSWTQFKSEVSGAIEERKRAIGVLESPEGDSQSV
jgi:hypothetical protein